MTFQEDFRTERRPLLPGHTVLDVGCGTGLCFPMLLDRIGATGTILGIDDAVDSTTCSRRGTWPSAGFRPAR